MSKPKIILFVILVVAVAFAVWRYSGGPSSPGAGGLAEDPLAGVVIYYTSNTTVAEYGNFEFEYIPNIAILKDDVEEVPGGRAHVIVLADADNRGETLEVNVAPCSSYSLCREVAGVPIGTDSSNERVRDAYDAIIDSFKVAPLAGGVAN